MIALDALPGLDQLSEGFAIFDRELKLILCNRPFLELRGYPEVLCRPGVALAELFLHNATRGDYGLGLPEVQVAERIRRLGDRTPQDVEVELVGGRKILARYRPGPNGNLLLIYEDITDIRRVEVTLREEEERYKLVTRAVSEGVYDWKVTTDQLHVSDRLKSLFDFSQIVVRSTEWFDRVHPDDAAGYRAALRALFKGEQERLQHEYRIRIGSREYRWVRDQAIALRRSNGRVWRLVGAVSDITDEKNRARDLAEALDYQTATSQVLGVISASPNDLHPAYEAILESVTRLCESKFASLFLYDGQVLRSAAHRGATPEFAAQLDTVSFPPSRGTTTRLAALERRVVHVPDLLADPTFAPTPGHKTENVRTCLSVPMLRGGDLIGVITTWRREVRPFSQRQIELVKTFAAQAVIAIQTARLFNETKEALETQTATADILRVISDSPTDVQPVFQAIAEHARVLCKAQIGATTRLEGDLVHLAGVRSMSAEAEEAMRSTFPMALELASPNIRRAIVEQTPIQIPDVRVEAGYPHVDGAQRMGFRSIMSVPLLHEGRSIGTIGVAREEPGLFPDRAVSLLQTFAQQAVIAIENVRLFNETQEALARQTASADILRVISSSPTDVTPVFSAIVEAAMRLLACDIAIVLRSDGKTYSPVAGATPLGPMVDMGPSNLPIDPDQNFPSRAIISKSMLHLPDWSTIELPPHERRIREALGVTSALYLPLLRGDTCLGVLVFGRNRTREFSGKEIALTKSFRDQAMIAIENVRLFNETKEALDRQTATANVLKAISRSTFDLAAVLETLIGTAARLCRASLGVIFKVEGDVCRPAGLFGATPALIEHLAAHPPLLSDKVSLTSRAVLARCAVQVEDAQNDPAYGRKDVQQVGGYRTLLSVPILREGVAVGVLTLGRTFVQAYNDKEIELVTSFADQAAIAMENVRLFNETKEALELQKASTEILGVISRSVADTQPVFEKILESCKHLFGGDELDVLVVDKQGMLQIAAYIGKARDAVVATFPAPWEITPAARAIRERRVANYSDVLNNPDTPPVLRRMGKIAGYHSVAFAPMVWEDRGIGVVGVARSQGAFTDKELTILQGFADQAVIAIQNSRLFKEAQQARAAAEAANEAKSCLPRHHEPRDSHADECRRSA